MANDVLRIEREGAVAIMSLNRPAQVNALNAELRAALRQAIAELETDSAIRVAILKGEGRGFCAGADLTGGMTHPDQRRDRARIQASAGRHRRAPG